MFRKTSQNRVYQDLVEQIQAAILSGKLKSGDKLPSQRELVEKFQTSRATLREALRVLQHKGLIEVRLGVSGGAIVRGINTEQITDGFSILLQHQKVSVDELAEFRKGVEGCVAKIAATRAKKRDVTYLKNLLKKARAHLSKWEEEWKDFLHVDLEFHIALAEISRNPIYVAVLRMIHENILEKMLFKNKKALTENYKNLCDIAEAVENKDPDRASILVQHHIDRCTNSIKIAQAKLKF